MDILHVPEQVVVPYKWLPRSTARIVRTKQPSCLGVAVPGVPLEVPLCSKMKVAFRTRERSAMAIKMSPAIRD